MAKNFAEESSKTKKAREKLKRKLEAVEKRITTQALKRKTIEIHRWIARHAQERIVLRTKAISLFDENQNAAKLSARVSHLAEQIKSEVQKFSLLPTPKVWNVKKKVAYEKATVD